MTRALILFALTACTGIPGNQDAFVLDGQPVAGYAWTGPGSYCCDIDGTENVGWQIWFTNTDYCPTKGSDAIGFLEILSPARVQAPSTELPVLSSQTVPITFVTDYTLKDPIAYIGTDNVEDVDGTLALSTYSTDEVAGTFTGKARMLGGAQVDIHGTFDGHRCDRIHDY